MAVIFADNPEYYFGLSLANVLAAGIWSTNANAPFLQNTLAVGRSAASDGKVYGWNLNGGSLTKTFATTYGRLIVGVAVYLPSVAASNGIISLLNSGAAQIDVRIADVAGHLEVTRGGTIISGTALSTLTIAAGWHYLELDVTLATGTTGSLAARWDGVTFLTYSGTIATAVTTALANQVTFGNITAMRDIYILDPGTSPNTSFLGDITVSVKYPTGPGTNNTWINGPATFTVDSVAAGTGVYSGPAFGATNALVGYDIQISGFANAANNGTFRCTANTATTLTVSNSSSVAETKTNKAGASYYPLTVAANASGGTTAYTGIFPAAAASNGWAGKKITISGFVTNTVNNGTFNCTASSTTSITLDNTGGISETRLATANLQIYVQDGINHLGTWPDGDTSYLYDSTTNDIVDLAHEALTLTGQIFSVVHVSYMRKDDAGGRSAAQVVVSGGTTYVGTTQSLGGAYQYYYDYRDVDPNTSAQWGLAGYNAATFGIKQLT